MRKQILFIELDLHYRNKFVFVSSGTGQLSWMETIKSLIQHYICFLLDIMSPSCFHSLMPVSSLPAETSCPQWPHVLQCYISNNVPNRCFVPTGECVGSCSELIIHIADCVLGNPCFCFTCCKGPASAVWREDSL